MMMSDQWILETALTGLPALVRLTALAMTMPVIAARVVPLRLRLAISRAASDWTPTSSLEALRTTISVSSSRL